MDSRYDVYGVGHAVVDSQFAVPPEAVAALGIDKGVMTLIDAPRRDLMLEGLAREPTRSASGGSAANSLIALCRYGGKAYFACQVGDDEWGDFYRRDLEEVGVTSSAGAHRPGPTGQCLVLVTPDADRTMNTFLGVSSGMGPDQIEPGVLAACGWVYLEGYLLTTEVGLEACLLAQAEARRRGIPVALTLSDPTIVDLFREHFDRLVGGGVDLVFCNDDEARALTREDDRDTAAAALAGLSPRVCITCGSEGALVLDHGDKGFAPGHPVTAVDTTGAGDAFAGGALYGLTRGHSLVEAAALGCYAAAHVVSSFGPRLEADLAAATAQALAGEAPIIAGSDT